jgi:transcriptional regulator with XRE-family HTH domain
MPVHEKIKFIRQLKGWSQDEVAEKLAMSANGYGNIERGETDVNLSRLEQIAAVFGIELSDLIALNEKNVFYLAGTHNTGQHNQHHCTIAAGSPEYLQLQAELDKQLLVNELKDKELALKAQEIAHLQKIIALLEPQDKA